VLALAILVCYYDCISKIADASKGGVDMKIKLKNPVAFKELLIRKGFTQRGLGRSAGIAESYATQIVNGKRNPGPQVVGRICNALKVSFDDIFFIDYACSSKIDPDSPNTMLASNE